MNSPVIMLRPHHLIDIIRNIGQGRPVLPHPYGHAQHFITAAILENPQTKVEFIVGADDLCKPCIHLNSEGLCDDILPQLKERTLKQEYNDDLDRRILAFLELSEQTSMQVDAFIRLIEPQLDKLTAICTHPCEDMNNRRNGLLKGIALLKGETGI